MSLWPRDDRGVPERTERLARAAMPRGCFAMRWRDVIGVLFEDESFRALFAARGRPAQCPWRLAVVSILQFVEGLTDRQAADAVRQRIDWKYLLGLELEDPGFDASVLSAFRTRLADSGTAEQLIFQRVLDLLAEADLIGPGGSQRTDSTKVLAQVRALDRLEMVGETLRAGLEAAAACAPDWLRTIAPPEWFTCYGPRVEGYRLPKSEGERIALAEQIGRDGMHLYTCSRRPDAPPHIRVLPALEALRAIWVQRYYQDEHGVHWRDPDRHGRPPGALAILSPYDLDVRWSTKRGQDWIGYKAQISETCDNLLPHIITYIAAVPATEGDIDTLDPLHEQLAAHRCVPAEHFVDSGYISAGHILKARTAGIDLVGPVPPNLSYSEIGFRPLAWGYPEVLCSCLIFADEAAEDSFSTDSRGLQVDDLRDRVVRIVVRNVLADALVRAGGVVVRRVFSQDGAQVCLVQDQQVVEQFAP